MTGAARIPVAAGSGLRQTARVIRYDGTIRIVDADRATALAAVEKHHRGQAHTGDFFMADQQLSGRPLRLEVDDQPAGMAVVDNGILSLCTLEPGFSRYDRPLLEAVLAQTGARQAYAASWDQHHVNLFGNFARGVDNQAYQFELVRPQDLTDPVPGLTLATAVEADLDYLVGTGFQDDYTGLMARRELKVARLDGSEVGVGVAVPQQLGNGRVDIGMFTEPAARRTGIGRSILALAAREVLAAGLSPAAGCWWRNWASRRTIEAAGLTCVGTIFRFELEPDRFRAP